MKDELIQVAIDPSHGGIDYGLTLNGINEKDVTLELSKYISNRLNELGIDAILTRNDDTTTSFDERIKSVKDTFGDRNNVILISNGINGDGTNADIIYSVRETNLDLVNNLKRQLEYEGIDNVATMQIPLPGNENMDANILQRNFDNVKVIIIEYGNLIESDDFEKISENIYNYGEGIVRGIAINYGLAYEPPKDIKTNTHIVKKGESLYSIAQKYNTTIGAIKSLNELKSNILSIGQVLMLPNYVNLTITADDITIYTIKKGDTLYNIAQRYGLDVDDLIEYNQLFNTVLSIGQQLIIPLNEEIVNDINNKSIIYIVKNGDTLYNIAKKYNVSANALMDYNNLDNTMIYTNQELLIPNTNQYITYYVRTGDTLEDIAKRFNTDVDFIKQINNLTNDDITIGQLLIIG